MKIIYRNVKKDDLATIVDLESESFHMKKDMTKKDMIGRIENYYDTFLVAEDEENSQVVGYVFGPAFSKRYIEDEIYFKNHPNRKDDEYQMILSLVVDKEYRHYKIASQLLTKMSEIAKKQGRKAISLNCLTPLIPFYELNGYTNEGKANDIPTPDGETTYNMVKELK